MKDLLGNDIYPTVPIVYATRVGNSGELKYGIVLKITEKDDIKVLTYNDWSKKHSTSTLIYPDRICVVEMNDKLKKEFPFEMVVEKMKKETKYIESLLKKT